MFTGIVVERGAVVALESPAGTAGKRLVVDHSAGVGSRLTLGASLAVAGVCLTVVEGSATQSTFELSPETLSRSRLGELVAGDPVNLEPPLRAGEALGGHWVQGHVDGTLELVGRRDLGEHRILAFGLPRPWRSWVVEKGSVTVDGVSLTVASLAALGDEEHFEVALIPHTLAVTTLGLLEVGQRVNFEADVLGKHVARAVELYGLTRGAP